MTVVFMWVISQGFWQVGGWQTLRYDTLAHCERDRPLIETGMRLNGFKDIVTVCKVSQEKSS